MNEFITCKTPHFLERPNHPVKLSHIDEVRPSDGLGFTLTFYKDRKQVYFWCFESREDRDEAMKEVRAQLPITTYTVPAGKIAVVIIPKKRGRK